MSTPQKNPATGGNRREANTHNQHRQYTAVETIEVFRAAMQAAGIGAPDHIRADGDLHRFKGDGDKQPNCWYVLHLDTRPAGRFGSHRADLNLSWKADGTPPNPEEQRRFARMIEADKRKRAAERQQHQRQAADSARAWWAESPGAAADHAYLTAKQVAPYGLRQSGELLLIPLRDLNGNLWNIQTITGDGIKRFQRGARITGLAAIVGNADTGEHLLICEGWATAATLHSDSGSPVLAAMNCGNLLHVAKGARTLWPDNTIIICGDDDRDTAGNPGRTAATAAANAIHARLAFPPFVHEEPGADFNDWAANRREVVA